MASPGTNEIRRLKALKKASAAKAPPIAPQKTVVKAPPPKPAPVQAKVEKVVVPMPPAPTEPTIDYSSMTKSQIQEVLKERGITYLPQSTKRILLGILKDA